MKFDYATVLTATSGKLLVDINELYKLCDHVAQGPVTTLGLCAVSDALKPYLQKTNPELFTPEMEAAIKKSIEIYQEKSNHVNRDEKIADIKRILDIHVLPLTSPEIDVPTLPQE